ncbi:MAG TPA: DUF5808 domain-containing protein [Coriobacteriia bacterium]|nr:DUF5808 domain-containing protein [Coriobacteriia bacterium]
MAVRDEDELAEPARGALRAYLEAVEAGLCAVDEGLAHETVAEVRAHFLHALSPASTTQDVDSIAQELGAPDVYAEGLCAAIADDDIEPSPLAGRILGVPYELRVPTRERVALRWWNPQDPRLFVPRVFGIGWGLNFASLAIRLHLLEPDAEDEPFENVSDRAFLLALLVPVAITAAMLGSFLALRSTLPVELPAHWDLYGVADRFLPATTAFLYLFALALAPTVWAVWSVALHRARLLRGASIGCAAFLASVAAGVWAITLVAGGGTGDIGPWAFPLVLIGTVAVPLGVFTALARSGRAEEMRTDMDRVDRSR